MITVRVKAAPAQLLTDLYERSLMLITRLGSVKYYYYYYEGVCVPQQNLLWVFGSTACQQWGHSALADPSALGAFPCSSCPLWPQWRVQIVRCYWRIARIYRVWVQLTGFAGSRDAVDSLPNSCRCRSEPVCRMCWLTLFSAANDAVLSRKNKSAVSHWLRNSNKKHMVVIGPLK